MVDKVETIKETLRRQDVQVEEIPAARSFNACRDQFKDFYAKHLAKSGVTFEEFEADLPLRSRAGDTGALPQQPVVRGFVRRPSHLGREESGHVGPEQGGRPLHVGDRAQRTVGLFSLTGRRGAPNPPALAPAFAATS